MLDKGCSQTALIRSLSAGNLSSILLFFSNKRANPFLERQCGFSLLLIKYLLSSTDTIRTRYRDCETKKSILPRSKYHIVCTTSDIYQHIFTASASNAVLSLTYHLENKLCDHLSSFRIELYILFGVPSVRSYHYH